MRRVFGQVSAAMVAVLILYFSTPFLPTSPMIEPISLTIEDGSLKYVRKVRVPMVGKHQVEVTQGREVFSQCNSSGPTVFEKRPNFEPVEWRLPCTLPDGEYKVEVCAVAKWFGVDMIPACISSVWSVGDPHGLRDQVDRIKRQVDILQTEIQKK